MLEVKGGQRSTRNSCDQIPLAQQEQHHTPNFSTVMSLCDSAVDAVGKHANSHIEMAMAFVKREVPAFLREDNDRLVKVGRSLENLVALKDTVSDFEASLQLLVNECALLVSGDVKVRFEHFTIMACIVRRTAFTYLFNPIVAHRSQLSGLERPTCKFPFSLSVA